MWPTRSPAGRTSGPAMPSTSGPSGAPEVRVRASPPASCGSPTGPGSKCSCPTTPRQRLPRPVPGPIGPGPHHLTFKVPDLLEAMRCGRRRGGTRSASISADPEWMEAFIHPKQATGVVVQLAQAPAGWCSPPPTTIPTERRQRADGSGPVAPHRCCGSPMSWPTWCRATSLFVGLLGGTMVDRGRPDGCRWVDLPGEARWAFAWSRPTRPGPGRRLSTGWTVTGRDPPPRVRPHEEPDTWSVHRRPADASRRLGGFSPSRPRG